MSSQNNGIAHEHIKNLEKQYLCATNNFNEAVATATRALDEFNRSNPLEGILKAYKEKVEGTKTKYEEVKDILKKLKDYVTWEFREIIVDSYDNVYLVLKNLKCISYLIESTHEHIRRLFELIDCLNNPLLSRDTSILKCLNELKAKTEDLLNANILAIKAVVVLLNKTIMLKVRVNGKVIEADDTERRNPQFGLICDLERLKTILEDYICKENTGSVAQNSDDYLSDKKSLCQDVIYCSEVILGIPTTELPKCDENISIGTYLDTLKGRLAKVEEFVQKAKDEMTRTKEAQKQAQAKKDAIKAALDAAKAVKDKCK